MRIDKESEQTICFLNYRKNWTSDVKGIGCPVHVLNNAVHHGCAILPTEVELIIVKFYIHFSTYTVRTEKLQAVLHWLGKLKILRAERTFLKFIIQFFSNKYAESYLFLIHLVISVIHTNIERVERTALLMSGKF